MTTSRRVEWIQFAVATTALGVSNALLRMPSTEAMSASPFPRHLADWFAKVSRGDGKQSSAAPWRKPDGAGPIRFVPRVGDRAPTP